MSRGITDKMNKESIYKILRLALGEELTDFSEMSAQEWGWAFSTLSIHGLAALGCVAVGKLPQDVRPPKEVVLKFISADMATQQSYARLKKLADKIEAVLKLAGVKCLMLKGLSLADYYPVPYVRKFVDIDLYAPDSGNVIDDAFKAKGVNVDTDFYRHSHMTLNGILVENHHCLLDVRGRKKLAELDNHLKEMAISHLSTYDEPGLYYPDAQFSLIFNLHHAMSHFIYEGISFKFLVDWIYFLRKERELLTTDQTASSLREHGLLKFAAVISEVSVRHLGLSIEDVPECIRIEMAALKPAVVDKFIDDLFRPYEQVHKKSIIAERMANVRRIVKSAWKPKEFLGQSAIGFVWDKFLPILRGKKFEAD